MAVKVRLMRIGSKGRPFYRIVAVDERKKRTGGYLDLLGTYNPLTDPKEVKIDNEKLAEWKKKGAVLSDGFLRIIGEAKQKQPRKPRKAQPETAPTVEPAPKVEKSENSDATDHEEAVVEEKMTSTEEKNEDQDKLGTEEVKE